MSRPASMLKTMTACFVALTLCTGFAGCSSAANNQQETAMTTANIEVEESAAKDIEECRTLEGLAKDEVHKQQMAKEDQNPLFGWYQHAYAYQGEEEILPYRLYVPEQSSQKMPLMVVCHGSDGLGSNNSSHVNQLSTSWISDAVQSKDPMYVIAIQMPEDTNPLADLEHCSRDKSTAVLQEYRPIIDEVIQAAGNIDEDRIYIMGHSLGDCASFNVMAMNPDFFAGALICAGATVNPAWGDKQDLSALKNENIYMVHGSQDQWILPSDARIAYDDLKQTGNETVTLEYFSMAGLQANGVSDDLLSEAYPPAGAAGHMVNQIAISEEPTEWMEWLISQKKGVPSSKTSEIVYWENAEEEIQSLCDMTKLNYETIGLAGSRARKGTVYTGAGRAGAFNDKWYKFLLYQGSFLDRTIKQ